MLKQRVLTAVALGALTLAAVLLLPKAALAWLLGLVTLLALWEWSNLAGFTRRPARAAYSAGGGIVLLACSGVAGLDGDPAPVAMTMLLGLAVAGWALAVIGVKGYPGSARWWGGCTSRAVMGWLAVLPTWLALVHLLSYGHGRWLILFLFALVAAADIGAYGFGRRYGSNKLAPTVSPGKSWEGFWGGLASGLLFALVVWWLAWSDRVGWPAMVAIAITTLLASVVGDLLESMVKRHRGIKDSSNILPGHGGVLDRLDSLFAAAPVFALGLLAAAW